MAEKGFMDFSFARDKYLKYRPSYPDSLFEEIVAKLKGARNLAVDVGAGPGQASVPLTKYFTNVIAVDPSPGQLEQATKEIKNLEFRQSTAESIDLPDHSVDLIISAQAVHWFHGESFYKETKRLLRPDGLLAVWGYWTTFEDPRAQKIFEEEFLSVVKSSFHPRINYLLGEYKDLTPMGYSKLERKYFSWRVEYELENIIGHLSTWSPLNTYMSTPNAVDPLPALSAKLEQLLKSKDEKIAIVYPVYLIYAYDE